MKDTEAFNRVLAAARMPKKTAEDRATRGEAMERANRDATEVPLAVLRRCLDLFPMIRAAAERGLPGSRSDAGVAAAAAGAAAEGAYLNVRINLPQLRDTGYREATRVEADRLVAGARSESEAICQWVLESLEAEG